MPSAGRLLAQAIQESTVFNNVLTEASSDLAVVNDYQIAPTNTFVFNSINDLPLENNTIGKKALVNDVLYFWNGNGWYKIALINTDPSFDSNGTLTDGV